MPYRSPRYQETNSLLQRESDKVEAYFAEVGYKVMESPWKTWMETNKRRNNITQSWMKMFEILNMEESVEFLDSLDEINAFHNCELPGSFLLASYYVCTSMGKKYNWVLSSHAPAENYGKDFLIDKFRLAERFPQNMLMGLYTTRNRKVYIDGDVTHLIVCSTICKKAKTILPIINLYTSDAGMAADGEGYLMELKTLTIKYGEIWCCLATLSPGGMAVIKLYTIDTNLLYSLVCVLANQFESFTLQQPQASQPANNELYFIGWNFKPQPDISAKVQSYWNSDPQLDLTDHIPVPESIIYDVDRLYCDVMERKMKAKSLYLNNEVPPGDYNIDNLNPEYQLLPL